MDVKNKLLKQVATPAEVSGNKVTVVGAGQVGMACAFSILSQGISSEIALVDVVADKLMGELMDLQHGSAFVKSTKISASTDYGVTANSKLIIITAGARQKEGETRLDLLKKNREIYQGMIPKLVEHSPNAVFLVVSNPVDILTYLTWKLSGLPANRVIGAGTNLDTSRFRFLISQRLNIAAESVHGWIIGEHGDSSVAVWSGVNVAGVKLNDLNENIASEEKDFKSIHKEVIESAYEIIRLKGYTSWAIGLSVGALTDTILRNTNDVHAVSTRAEGTHGINENVFLSLPCVLGENGVTHIVKQPLTEDETNQLQKSATVMDCYIKQLEDEGVVTQVRQA